MSSKQRKARRESQRAQWADEQTRLAAGRRRRTILLLGVLAAVVVLTSVVAFVALAVGDDPDQSAEGTPGGNTELLASEEAADAQSSAVADAMASGELIASDYTVEPGTPVDSALVPVPSNRPIACGASSPASAGATRPQYPGGPAHVLQAGPDYVAVIETSCGSITIDLLEQDAPVAVNSFVFLAEEGFYDGLEVFRDFGAIAAAQAGSGDNSVNWDIGYRLPDELDLAGREGYPIGSVTTVGEGPYTAGSEFQIAYGKEFDAGFQTDRTQTTFGKVVGGMDVIETIAAIERSGMGGEVFSERVFMESVTIKKR